MPAVFLDWVKTQRSEKILDMLREKHNDNKKKYSRMDKEDMYSHYKDELERMRNIRANGETGRIEFLAWD